MPKTAADVEEDFVDNSDDDGSTSDSSSEEDDSEAVVGRGGRPPSCVYDDPANVAWRLQGVAARCGQDEKRLGIVFVNGAPPLEQTEEQTKEQTEDQPDKPLGRRSRMTYCILLNPWRYLPSDPLSGLRSFTLTPKKATLKRKGLFVRHR